MEWHTMWYVNANVFKINVKNGKDRMNVCLQCSMIVTSTCIYLCSVCLCVCQWMCAINFLICAQNFTRKMSFKKLRPFNLLHIHPEMTHEVDCTHSVTACVWFQIWCLKTIALHIHVRMHYVQIWMKHTHATMIIIMTIWCKHSNKFSHLNSNTSLLLFIIVFS